MSLESLANHSLAGPNSGSPAPPGLSNRRKNIDLKTAKISLILSKNIEDYKNSNIAINNSSDRRPRTSLTVHNYSFATTSAEAKFNQLSGNLGISRDGNLCGGLMEQITFGAIRCDIEYFIGQMTGA